MNYSGIVVSTALLMLLWLHTLALPLWRHALDRKVRRVIDPSRILDSLLSKIGFSTVSFHPADPDQAMALVPLGYFAKYPDVNLIAGTVEEETLFEAVSDFLMEFMLSISDCLNSVMRWAKHFIGSMSW